MSEVEGEPTPHKSGADLAESSMTAGSEGPQERKISENGSMHSQSQGDPKQNSDPALDLPLPKLSDPLDAQIPKPEGDPFEQVLKSMREKDTIQCDAWKDEVQNVLIFAGLFSAVVTAFILESYQRLQPDPNDAIVGLLAHIAERLDSPSINATASVSSIVTNTGFSPSRPDVNINICWFISLILSLTVAFIGIITLQWLREHQRYDNTLKPRETMAILNARLHSLTQWYVPQIFAGLPLLLQGAIVLFFAGMIEFLFALSFDVAVPVLLSICIPVLFLIATTLLPVLQMCILQFPYRLSINNDLPSPCPYKSPQSLIARRVSIASDTAFTCLTLLVAGPYACIVQISYFARRFCGYWDRLPFFQIQKENSRNLNPADWLPRSISKSLRDSEGDWTSIDKTWLEIRTTYAVSLQLVHEDNNDLIAARIWSPLYIANLPELPEGLPTDLVDYWMKRPSLDLEQSLLPEVLDCSHAVMQVLALVQADTEIGSAAYHCLSTLCSQPFQHKEFHLGLGIIQAHVEKSAPVLAHLANLCVAFGRLLHYHSRIDTVDAWECDTDAVAAPFVEDVINNEPSKAAEILYAAFMTSSRPAYTLRYRTNIEREWVVRLVATRLAISPQRLFLLSSAGSWIPTNTYSPATFTPQPILGDYSQSIMKLLLVFLENCSTMKPSSELLLRPAARGTYGGIRAYMEVIVCNQGECRISDTLAHLTESCNSSEDIIREKPFLLIAACFYLQAAASRGLVSTDEPLLRSIVNACGIENDRCRSHFGWGGLDDAINAIYHHHNPPPAAHLPALPAPPLDQSLATSLANPNGHDNV